MSLARRVDDSVGRAETDKGVTARAYKMLEYCKAVSFIVSLRVFESGC